MEEYCIKVKQAVKYLMKSIVEKSKRYGSEVQKEAFS